ncbi:MAG: hypothetical protein WC910_07715 [Bacteroidales bacterium]
MRCHGAGDFVRGQNRDWARVTGNNYVLQKLILYFAIPKGEVINAPEIGCCLHEYLFAPLTPTNIYLIESTMESEIGQQIPELGIHSVSAEKVDEMTVKLRILGYATWLIQMSRSDLLDLNLIDTFQEAAAA